MTAFEKIVIKIPHFIAIAALLLWSCAEIPNYTVINVEVSPSKSGTVSGNPPGPEYEIGTRVTFAAKPANGYRFSNWTGDVSDLSGKSEANATITLSGDKYNKYNDKKAIANFVKVYTLTVINNPSVGGRTTHDRITTHDTGAVVTVTAMPNDGYRFDRWSGMSTSTNPTVTVTMNGDKTLTAHYVCIYTLTVINSPSIGGKTTHNGTTTYDSGTVVTVKAVRNYGYRFDKWSGASISTDSTITVTMNGDKTLTACYIRIYTFSVNVSPSDGGTVRATVNGNVVATPTILDSGTVVTVTVTANSGYQFTGWSGVPSGVNQSAATITFPITGELSLTANFGRVYTLRIAISPTVGGTVTVNGATVNGTTILPGSSTVTVRAIDADGYGFVEWSGASTLKNSSITLTMNRDTTLTANFVSIYTVTYNGNGHTSGLAPTDAGRYSSDAAVTILGTGTLTMAKYAFMGWKNRLNGVIYSAGDTLKITNANVILDAQWELDAVFFDDRDYYKTYRMVTIGGKTWMAENLNYQTSGGKCYEDDNSNCDAYGMLYDWNTALEACPSDWQLPTRQEWTDMVNTVGMPADTKLMSVSWDGTDEFGFSALPGMGNFPNAPSDQFGCWWTNTPAGTDSAYYRIIGLNHTVVNDNVIDTDVECSVRCVKR
jgi:uncharacterized protein (TIGR02145 family)